MLQGIKIPDVPVDNIPSTADFSMVAGDFVEVYSHPDQKGQWDVIVTCFFIDTARNILHYVEVIKECLKPGGVWINLGPLLYHYEGMQGETSIELSFEEVKAICEPHFEMIQDETLSCTYTGHLRSMLTYAYTSRFCVWKKRI